MINYKKYYLILLILLSSCGLFSTRDPESPDSGKSNYILPNSALDVVSNFKNSIIEKNAENYISCFLDTSNSMGLKFNFVPSPDAYALYKSFFDEWDIEKEKRSFYSILSNLGDDVYPKLEMTNYNPVDAQSESWTITYDYKITIDHKKEGYDKVFAGTLQFVIVYNKANTYWYIKNWIDNNPANDSIPSTWSMLKVQFAN